MEISAFITLVGIIIAILALINSNDRSYIFLKFTWRDKALIVVALILIHFLFSYQYWKRIFGWLAFFDLKNFPTPSAWAYLISIGVLTFVLIKIFANKFPASKTNEVVSFYKSLLRTENYEFLEKLIEKYHSKNIMDYVKAKASSPRHINDKYDKKYHFQANGESLESRRLSSEKYGLVVYEGFFTNEDFVLNVANRNPYLFVECIKLLNNANNANPEFVNTYLKALMKKKNRIFFKEIRFAQKRESKHGSYDLDEEDVPILASLFKDARVAKLNNVWKSIGEQGYYEIIAETKQETSYLRDPEIEIDDYKDTIWEFRIKAAISFFDIMYREAIVQRLDDHMWIYYYEYFTKGLIDNIHDKRSTRSNTRNHQLIEEIINNLIESVRISLRCGNLELVSNSYKCLGICLYPIITSNKISKDFSASILDSIFNHLMTIGITVDLKNDDKKKYVFEEGIKMLRNPANKQPLKDQRDVNNLDYLRSLIKLWERRDKFRQENSASYGEACRIFKEEIIDNINV